MAEATQQLVNVKEPGTGEIGSVPANELTDLLNQGYTQPSPEEVQGFMNEQKHGTPEEMLKTGAEAAANAFTLGAFKPAEKYLFGVPGENILGREKANPGIKSAGEIAGLAASIPLGDMGALGLLGNAGKAASEIAELGPIAKGAIRSATETALYSAGDQTSKLLMNDPDTSLGSAAAAVGLSGLLGGVVGGGLGSVNALWKATNEGKMGQFVQDFVGRAKERLVPDAPVTAETPGARFDPFLKEFRMPGGGAPSEIEVGGEPGTLSKGGRAFDAIVDKGLKKLSGKALGAAVGGALGHASGMGWLGAMVGEQALGPVFDSVIPGIIQPMLEAAPNGAGLKAAIDYGLAVVRGENLMGRAAKGIFQSGADVLETRLTPSEKDTEKLDKTLQSEQQEPERMLAIGNDLQHYMSNHATKLAGLTANAVQYLNSLRPAPVKQLPFDSQPTPSLVQKQEFNNALSIAEQPLQLFYKVRDGTITKTDMQHLSTLYPALYPSMANKLFEAMTGHLTKGNDIPYRTRLGASLFLGQPLDSTMTPMAILSMQSKMARGSSPQGPSMMTRSSRALKIPLMAATPSQTRQIKDSTHF